MQNKKLVTGLVVVAVLAGASSMYFSMPDEGQQRTITGHAVLAALSAKELVRGSEMIAIGYIKDAQALKTSSKVRKGEEDIVTHAVLEVEKYIRKPNDVTGNTITIETLGGTVGTTRMNIDGTPIIEEGERVLVFLKRDASGAFVVYGWKQGKYSIDAEDMLANEEEKAVSERVFGKTLLVSEIEALAKALPYDGSLPMNTQIPEGHFEHSLDGNERANDELN